jgi:macrolide-specific efflux system membrane fusion protein
VTHVARFLCLGLPLVFLITAAPLAAQDPTVVEPCYLGAIQDVQLTPDAIGKLVKVFVNDGDSVAEGDVVAQIDDEVAVLAREVARYEYAAAVEAATNDVSVRAAVAANGVETAEVEKIIEANARKSGSYTETEVLRATLKRDHTGLQIEHAKHQMDLDRAQAWVANAKLKQADAEIGRRKLKAPFAGVINQVVREKGEWVGQGDPVVHLVQMDRLRVHGRVNADNFHWNDIKGRVVEVTVHLPGDKSHQVEGRIGFASPVVDDDGTFRVWAEIENTRDGQGWVLGPGFPATMRLR